MLEVFCYNKASIAQCTKILCDHIQSPCFIALNGKMGAGKTTFVQSMMQAAGVAQNVSSPTFNIVNIYDSSKGEVWHYDLYRLNDSEELWETGIEEAYANHCMIVEWPELTEGILLPDITLSLFSNITDIPQAMPIDKKSLLRQLEIDQRLLICEYNDNSRLPFDQWQRCMNALKQL